MGLFDMFKGEFIDVIEWTDSTQDTMVWKFPRYDNAIKNGAKLTVRESQMVVFLHEGEFGDVFGPGLHTLNTNNIPILTTLKSWKYAFNSPFKADAIYVNTKNFTNMGWGTQSAVTLSDPRFGMYEVKARGTYAMRITDPKLFIKEIVGTDTHFTTEEVTGQLRSLIVSKFMDALAESGITADKVASNFDELGKFGMQKLQEEFTGYGLQITKFVVENVEMPEEIKKEIYSYSRLTSGIDIGKLAQFKAAQAIEKAAENPGGLAGAGAGIGVGFGVANTMTQAFAGMNQPQQQQAPPPIPQAAKYFLAVNGKQEGPYEVNQLSSLIASGMLKPDTLVWKQGMSGWEQASTVTDISGLFGAVPPPIPG